MARLTLMNVFCNACGTEISTDFQHFGGKVCSMECFREFQWRKTLSMLGIEYYPDPRKEEDSA